MPFMSHVSWFGCTAKCFIRTAIVCTHQTHGRPWPSMLYRDNWSGEWWRNSSGLDETIFTALRYRLKNLNNYQGRVIKWNHYRSFGRGWWSQRERNKSRVHVRKDLSWRINCLHGGFRRLARYERRQQDGSYMRSIIFQRWFLQYFAFVQLNLQCRPYDTRYYLNYQIITLEMP